MRIIASQHDSKGPSYIAAELTRAELVAALDRIGLPDAYKFNMTLENVRFDGDFITVELGRSQSYAIAEPK